MKCPKCKDIHKFGMIVTQTFQGGVRMIKAQCKNCSYIDYIEPDKYKAEESDGEV